MATSLYSGTLAHGASTADLPVTLPANYSEVVVTVSVSEATAFAEQPVTVGVAYSEDSASTWSDYVDIGHATASQVGGSQFIAPILVGISATNFRVKATNNDGTVAATVNISYTVVSGQTSVSFAQGTVGRVTAGGPAPGQVLKNYTGVVIISASPQTIPIETVTTGRNYLITDIVITTNDTAAAALIQIQAGGVNLFQSHINSTKGIEVPGIETQPTALSTQVVNLLIPAGTAGKQIAYNVYGVES